MPIIRSLQRASQQNHSGYVCRSCRQKLLTTRSQQVRWQTHAAENQPGDDDWLSNFNDVSAELPSSEQHAPTNASFLEYGRKKKSDKDVEKKRHTRRERVAEDSNGKTLHSFKLLKSNLSKLLDPDGVAEKQRREGSFVSNSKASKFPARPRSQSKAIGNIERARRHRETKSTSKRGRAAKSIEEEGLSVDDEPESQSAKFRDIIQAMDEKQLPKMQSKSSFESIVSSLKDKFANMWSETHRASSKSSNDRNIKTAQAAKPAQAAKTAGLVNDQCTSATEAGVEASPDVDPTVESDSSPAEPRQRIGLPDFASSSPSQGSGYSWTRSVLNPEKPLTIVQKVQEAKNRPKWGGLESQRTRRDDANTGFLNSLQESPETAEATPRAYKGVRKVQIDVAPNSDKSNESDIASLKDSLSVELKHRQASKSDSGVSELSQERHPADAISEKNASKSFQSYSFPIRKYTKGDERSPSSSTTKARRNKPVQQSINSCKIEHAKKASDELGHSTNVESHNRKPETGEEDDIDEAVSKLAALHSRRVAVMDFVNADPSDGIPQKVVEAPSSDQETVKPAKISRGSMKKATVAGAAKTGGRKSPRRMASNKRISPRKVSSTRDGTDLTSRIDEQNEAAIEHKSLAEVMRSAAATADVPTGKEPEGAAEKGGEDLDTSPVELPSEPPIVQSIKPADLTIEPLNIPQPPVPGLAYDLDRVLFNPGVYQLQDPHTRVYNFDPYLQNIMPVVEFDFNALKEYKTSSRDTALSAIAEEHGKRYIGSTSSMTGTLGHFHYLISEFRPVNLNMLSRGFSDKADQFTRINTAPNAVFLRWQDGKYAIDADKEYDGANVLMMLGKSMEKLLTLPTSEYERYRKSDPRTVSEEERQAPESYEYTTMGDFLMRSQLDAYDSRLPGKGMFDLKTRAVLSVRMDAEDFQPMTGYEIYSLHGKFGSYEREYYDMIRSTLLKYMLQARMGRMDGIFIAYHNVERIFGFQYMPISEMDRAIHGQVDRCLGDQEFKTSLELMNKVLDKATAKYPEQSLRLHFETKFEDVGTGSGTTVMWIFAEPMAENEIERIQAIPKAKIAEFERTMLGMDKETEAPSEHDITTTNSDADDSASEMLKSESDAAALDESQPENSESSASEYNTTESAADPVFVNNLPDSGDRDLSPLFVASIICKSRVNDTSVPRPESLKPDEKWEVEYLLQEWPVDRRMWARYEDTKAKRKETFEKYRDEDDDTPEGEMTKEQKRSRGYIDFLRGMSQQGREYRDKLDRMHAAKEPVVVGQPSHSSAGSDATAKVNSVDDYIGMLYAGK